METYPIRMSVDKAQRLSNMLKNKQGEISLDRGNVVVNNQGSSAISKGAFIRITDWYNNDYAYCLRHVKSQRASLIGVPSSSPTPFTSKDFIRVSYSGHAECPSVIIAQCNAANELATTGADWYYCDTSFNLIPNATDDGYKIIAKSLVGNNTTYRICLLMKETDAEPASTSTSGSGSTDTITYCSAVAVSSGNLVFTFTQKDVLVP